MKCLVSGATGFIGDQLCQQLEAQGHIVIALSRTGNPLSNGKLTLAVDLAENDPDEDLLQGVDVVFHLAGIAHQQAPDSAYEALNYRATVRLARLASAAGARCFIFLSSVKAMGLPESVHMRSERECTLPVEPYGMSKLKAERALQQAFSKDEMSMVILRPTLVYGADFKGNLRALSRGIRWGLPRPPEGGARSMIALEDLVSLLCVIGECPPKGVHVWIASGAKSYSTQAIYDLMRKANGKGRGVGWLPQWGWWIGALVLDIASGRRDASTYAKLFGTELYSNASVLADTDWRPQATLEQVITQAAMSGDAAA